MSIVAFGVLVFVTLLMLAAVAVPLARYLGLPVTLVIAAFGLTHGVFTTVAGFAPLGGILDTYDSWFVDQLGLDSDSLIFLFLPPLLFEMALAVNVRRLTEELGVVIVMAVLAVIVATLIIGGALSATAPVGLIAALMFGAAVATTDPGAVISTFREIGAPKRLLTILEGESLLNDAAAIAIFALLLSLLRAEIEPSLGSFVLLFCYSFGTGAAIGLGIAYAASFIYPWLARSNVAECSLTLVVAYGAFLVAEVGAGASGVVAVVFAGLATGSTGFLQMGPGNWPTVRAVWTQIGFWSNALIMIIATSLVPGLIAEQGWYLVPLALLVYAGAAAARAIILFGLLPAMAWMGLTAPIGWRQSLLLVWGGVRGSVTLVLAISLADLSVLDETAGLLGALAALYTLMTIFLNASTLAWLAGLLRLNELSPSDIALREQIVAGARERVQNVVRNLARARDLEPEALATVEAAVGGGRSAAEVAREGRKIPFGERLVNGLKIISGQESRLIRRAFDEGAIGPRAASALRLDADRITDAALIGGRDGYQEAATAALGVSARHRLAIRVQRWFQIDRPLRGMIEIHFTKLLESERIVRELRAFSQTTVAPMIGEDAAENLIALLTVRHKAIETEIEAISSQYPSYAIDLEKTLVARAAIRRERQQYLKIFNDGVIGQELYDELVTSLDRRERIVARPPRLDLMLTPIVLLGRVPLFAELDTAQRRRLAEGMRTRFTSPGEVILAQGQRGTEVFFVASGAVDVQAPERNLTLGTGSFFGEITLIRPLHRRRSRVLSRGHCRLLVLHRRHYLRIAKDDATIREIIEQAAKRQMNDLF